MYPVRYATCRALFETAQNLICNLCVALKLLFNQYSTIIDLLFTYI
jgi:hypothetical protein